MKQSTPKRFNMEIHKKLLDKPKASTLRCLRLSQTGTNHPEVELSQPQESPGGSP